MPDTYRVKLSDGRTVRVQSDAGPPSEADILAQLGGTTAAAPAPAAKPAEPSALQRFFKPAVGTDRLSDVPEGLIYSAKHPLDALGLVGGALWEGAKNDPVGMIPFVGHAKRIGEDLSAGNYAGATGEVANAALSWLLPKAGRLVGPAGRATAGLGGLVEDAGGAISREGLLKGLSKAAVAPIVEKTGQQLKRAGGAMAALEEATGAPAARAGAVPGRPAIVRPPGPRTRWFGNREVPGFSMPENFDVRSLEPPAAPMRPPPLGTLRGPADALRERVAPPPLGTLRGPVEVPPARPVPPPPLGELRGPVEAPPARPVAPPPLGELRGPVEAPPARPVAPPPLGELRGPVEVPPARPVAPPPLGELRGPVEVTPARPVAPPPLGELRGAPVEPPTPRAVAPPPLGAPRGVGDWLPSADSVTNLTEAIGGAAPSAEPSLKPLNQAVGKRVATPKASAPAAPAPSGTWVDAAREQIGRAQAMGVDVDPALLDAVAEAERAPATASRGPSRGARGRFGPKK
jgi:hypothetical protein